MTDCGDGGLLLPEINGTELESETELILGNREKQSAKKFSFPGM